MSVFSHTPFTNGVMDRRLRAFVLVMSEALKTQQDIIDDNKCTLEMTYNEKWLIQINISQGSRYICNDVLLTSENISIIPFCTKRSFTMHKLFANLLNKMILKSEIYCMTFAYVSRYSGCDMSIYFLYDGTVRVQTSGDYDDNKSMIKLDSESAFSTLIEMYNSFRFEIMDMEHSDELFSMQ
jgi:hypothetical protein